MVADKKQASRNILPSISSARDLDNEDTSKIKKQMASLLDDVPSNFAQEQLL